MDQKMYVTIEIFAVDANGKALEPAKAYVEVFQGMEDFDMVDLDKQPDFMALTWAPGWRLTKLVMGTGAGRRLYSGPDGSMMTKERAETMAAMFRLGQLPGEHKVGD